MGPSPKSSRSDLKNFGQGQDHGSHGSGHGVEYPKLSRVAGDDGDERDRLVGGRPSEDLYRGPSLDQSRGARDPSSSPEGSPVRYTQRL